jgi:hypothetical protein
MTLPLCLRDVRGITIKTLSWVGESRPSDQRGWLRQCYDKDQEQDHKYQNTGNQKYDFADQIRLQQVFTTHEIAFEELEEEVAQSPRFVPVS